MAKVRIYETEWYPVVVYDADLEGTWDGYPLAEVPDAVLAEYDAAKAHFHSMEKMLELYKKDVTG